MTNRELYNVMANLWSAVSGQYPESAPLSALSLSGERGQLAANHPVETAATATIATALFAGVALDEARGKALPTVSVNQRHVAAAMHSGAAFRWNGRLLGFDFAPLSRFWEVADGWVRTHANYPWHRRALLRVLDVATESEAAVRKAMQRWPAGELEAAVWEAGGIATAMRSPDEWSMHPQGMATAAEPLVDRANVGGAAARPWPPGTLPAEGLRVLDLTRVIAGPVCTRYLAALGAAVLRIDPPQWPDLPVGLPADTLLGKRSSVVDFTTVDGRVILDRLLGDADIVILGYRPGSLDRFGLIPENLSQRFPGLVIILLSAWGHHGPWASRRGFDSVVQSATGIGWLEGGSTGRPGSLPCQLLDHGTGYLAAAAALDGIREQRTHGGTPTRRLSLARTAHWLRQLPPDAHPDPTESPHGSEDWVVELQDAPGTQQALLPVGRWNGHQLQWPKPAAHYASDRPEW